MTEQEALARGSKILVVSDVSDYLSSNISRKSKQPLTSGVTSLIHNLEQALGGEYTFLNLNPYSLKGDKSLFPVRWIPPRYPQFELAIPNPVTLWQTMRDFKPDAIFNVTPDGSIGRMAKLLCHFPGSRDSRDGRQLPYALAYTSNLDQYVSMWVEDFTKGWVNIPSEQFDPYFRLVFKGANKVMVPTKKSQDKLHRMGINNTVVLPRGVDTGTFRLPNETDANPYLRYDWYRNNPLPVFTFHGRVSLVKSIDEFLSLDTPNAYKIVIGEGPYRQVLERQFVDPQIHFLGARYGEDLASHIRYACLSFFPSKTDTWGQAVTEAMASGVPVIAYNTQGPGEIVIPGVTGELVPIGTRLSEVIPDAIKIDRVLCAQTTAAVYSWENTARILVQNLTQINWKN